MRSFTCRRPEAHQLEDRRLLSISLVSLNAAGTGSGNDESSFVGFSSDGRFVLFSSKATDLVTGITDSAGTIDLFVRDRVTGTTELVTVNASGTATPDESTFFGQITPDGRYVLFNTTATDLVAGLSDNNSSGFKRDEVFVRDLLTDTTTLVSINSTGTGTGDDETFAGGISPDGRFVVFNSPADDLVAGFADGNGLFGDVYVRDLVAGTTSIISQNAAGTASGNANSGSPSLSGDGRFAFFSSVATDLVTGITDANGSAGSDIFVHDLAAGTTSLVSVNASGTGTGNETSFNIRTTPDGRFVVFESIANDLVTGVTDDGGADIFIRDLEAGVTKIVSVNPDGSANGQIGTLLPNISADGRIVAFDSLSNLLPSFSDMNTGFTSIDPGADIFARDLTAGVTSLVSVNAAGNATGNQPSFSPRLSPNGRFVTFFSAATDLVTGLAASGNSDVYIRDLTTGMTALVSVNAAGTGPGSSQTTGGEFSADGRVIALNSMATDLIAGLSDTNGVTDVYVADAPAGGPAGVVPTAVLPAQQAAAVEGSATYDFQVVYTDDVSVDNGTFGEGDVEVTLPGGGTQAATFVGIASSTATSATVTYHINAPGGSLDAADNGVYGVAILPNAVADSAGNPIAPGSIGSFTISVTGAGGGNVDLSGAVIAKLPAAVVGGASGRASVRVRNAGPQTLSQSVMVNLFASSDDVLDGADAQIASVTRRLKLRANGAKTLKFAFKFPTTVPDGSYRLLAQIDAASAVAESNESNNVAASTSAVTIAAPFIDLTATLAKPPATLTRGKRVSIPVSIRNNGNVTTSGPPASVVVLASTDESQDGSDTVLGTFTGSLRIRPNASRVVKVRVTTPLELAAGTYSLIGVADSTSVLAESDEGNNAAVAAGIAVS